MLDLNAIRRWIVLLIALVTAILFIKVLFWPNPLDVLALFALVLALFFLFDLNDFKRD